MPNQRGREATYRNGLAGGPDAKKKEISMLNRFAVCLVAIVLCAGLLIARPGDPGWLQRHRPRQSADAGLDPGSRRGYSHAVAAYRSHPFGGVASPAQRAKHSSGKGEVRIHARERGRNHNEVHDPAGERDSDLTEYSDKGAAGKAPGV